MYQTLTGRLVSASAEEASPKNSSLMRLRFIFTDFKPNSNKVVVPPAEAENIMASALFMPIKIDFSKDAPNGHSDSLPIGTIIKVEQEDDLLIGNALMWKDEFPNIASWIDENKDTDNVQFSWELWTDPEASSETDDRGNRILRGIEVKSTVIVDNPAYNGRTKLLSVAEKDRSIIEKDNAILNLEATVLQLSRDIQALKEEAMENEIETPTPTTEEVVPPTENVETSNDEADTSATTEAERLLNELEELRTFRRNIEEREQRASKISERSNILAQAGIKMPAERFESRADFYLSLTDEQFGLYVEDLRMVTVEKSEASVETASNRTGIVPEPITSVSGRTQPTTITIKDLAKELRNKAKS